LRAHLTNILSYSRSSEKTGNAETLQRRIRGCTRLFNFIFPNGFEKPGTYNRIAEQRLILVPQKCQIRTKANEDGCIAFKGIGPIKLDGQDAIAYYWVGGTNDYPQHDPITGAEKLLDYMAEYANTGQAAKTKT